MLEAVNHLQEKGNIVGTDGLWSFGLHKYLQKNHKRITRQILQNVYEPRMVQEFDILNARSKKRTVSKIGMIDSLILRAIHQVFYKTFVSQFSFYSFAYQEKKSPLSAARVAAGYIEDGFRFVVDIDIEHFFDHVSHQKMLEILYKKGVDDTTCRLIKKFLRCKVSHDYFVYTKKEGLLQGSPLSPMLSNIFLNEVDCFFKEREYKFCRFADDIRLFAHSEKEGQRIFVEVQNFLERNLSLRINSQKSGVFRAIDRIYLGYRFYRYPDGKIELKKKDRHERENFSHWHYSSLKKVNAEYHVTGDGILTQKDFTLLFENPEKKMYLPIETMGSLNMYANILFSSKFFEFASKKNLQLNFFTRYGDYLGAFIPKNLLSTSSLVPKQAEDYANSKKRLTLAKKFSLTAAHNIRENLKYYARHRANEKLFQTITIITYKMTEEKQAKTINKLMLLEGQVRGAYYQCLNIILEDSEFLFTRRTRRPPRDALNALISFGNTLLYRWVAKEVYKSNLDIRIGFLHSTNRRYESLNLDIAEIFRPVIVERLVFTLINKKMLHIPLHFEKKNGGVYLNKEGKKIFLVEFDKKMAQIQKQGDHYYSYASIIKREIQKLENFFEKGVAYKPYKYFL